MATSTTSPRGSSKALSLTLPSPKALPGYPDLYGKRRDMVRVQMLEREISFLEEELKSSEGLQQASRCCKEIDDFVVANSDPLLPTNKKNRRSCRFWKWLCRMPCFNLSWICCCCCDGCFNHLKLPSCRCCCDGCSNHLKLPSCCCCCKPCTCRCNCLPSISCCLPKWPCCSARKSHCCKESRGCKNCCVPPSCNCNMRCPCCCCTKSCWNPCSSCC